MKHLLSFIVFCMLFTLCARDFYLVGDSTMARYRPQSAPQAGWGMFLTPVTGSKIFNFAIGGRSTKSYRESGAWANVMKRIKAGDVMVIQFGHNDANQNRPQNFTTPGDYRANLERFVKELQAARIQVIIASPTSPLRFNKKQQPYSYLTPYAQAAKEAAAACKVPFIDMTAFGISENGKAGKANAQKYYMYLAPGEHKNWPKGIKDAVHLNETGAKLYADFFLREMRSRKLPGYEIFK